MSKENRTEELLPEENGRKEYRAEGKTGSGNKSGSHRRKKKKKMPVGRMILLDLLAIALGLVVFALFHHVLDYWDIHLGKETAEPVVIATLQPQPAESAVPTNAPQTIEATPEPETEPTPEPVYYGMWGEKFADKFTEGEVVQTENSYRSANVNVSYRRVEEDYVIYYVAEVYVSDVAYLRSAFGNGKYNGGFQFIEDMAKDAGAIVAITGDHYAGRYEGIVVRNGEWYRDVRFEDVCVLYRDGSMETIDMRRVDVNALKEKDVWQIWCFGPELLDAEGRAKDKFNTVVYPANPRSAIGCVEPGHYFFVEVEGSRGGVWTGSRGMDMRQLAELFESLGCTSAYNLDGGRSVGFAWMGERISSDYGRSIPDIIYVADTPFADETPEQG